ncbi:hypothetical protein SAMN04487886_11922 [Clostridium sp. DSM 8431]|uniref:hypothetical protein n=1 Tax=Clostridium sp. DSM 8431 TaxID=1761781 RepID=UPI0008E95EC0|nr:hypothetical protein [Clostridium sp. DSM 8431]SFU82338.1 hypothetical protein SAMN04487886_11922 [Clostridium sp. DSM 8431]
MSQDKVIVFIVEGFSDKETLDGILTELFDEKSIVFSIVDGDITTQNSTKVDNIRSKIGKCIDKAMQKDKFLNTNIDMIVHLIDTDGAYIPDSNIIENKNIDILYNDSTIETENVDNIINRNHKKRTIVNILSTMQSINKGRIRIPYYMFYMSCNLEHVLHNIKNATQEEKNSLAEDIEDRYIENPSEFVNFMTESDFSVKGEYKDTWDFIKQDINSICRYSNFGLFFEISNPKN